MIDLTSNSETMKQWNIEKALAKSSFLLPLSISVENASSVLWPFNIGLLERLSFKSLSIRFSASLRAFISLFYFIFLHFAWDGDSVKLMCYLSPKDQWKIFCYGLRITRFGLSFDNNWIFIFLKAFLHFKLFRYLLKCTERSL